MRVRQRFKILAPSEEGASLCFFQRFAQGPSKSLLKKPLATGSPRFLGASTKVSQSFLKWTSVLPAGTAEVWHAPQDAESAMVSLNFLSHGLATVRSQVRRFSSRSRRRRSSCGSGETWRTRW